jgi:hypothetical protein
LRKTAFERQKPVKKFQFRQTAACGKISELSSNIFVVKNFQNWLIFPENVASFPYPPNAKISTFQQTALSDYDTAQQVNLPASSNQLILTEIN